MIRYKHITPKKTVFALLLILVSVICFSTKSNIYASGMVHELDIYEYYHGHDQYSNAQYIVKDSDLFAGLYSDMESKNVEKYLDIPKGCFEDDEFVYNLENNGKGVIIYKYKGSEEKCLVLPKEIQGFPVTTIASLGKSVEEIVIPNSVRNILEKAFLCCGIKKVVFEENSRIQRIGKLAFAFNRLESIDLPRREIVIGEFAYCMNPIKEISIYKGWSFDCSGEFFAKDNITNILFPKTDEHFYNSVTVYYDKSRVGNFWYGGMILPLLEKVIFEEGCKTIYSWMFYKSPNLKEVRLPSTLEECRTECFLECYNLETIFVPKELRNVKVGELAVCFEGKNLSLGSIKQLMDAGFNMKNINRE